MSLHPIAPHASHLLAWRIEAACNDDTDEWQRLPVASDRVWKEWLPRHLLSAEFIDGRVQGEVILKVRLSTRWLVPQELLPRAHRLFAYNAFHRSLPTAYT